MKKEIAAVVLAAMLCIAAMVLAEPITIDYDSMTLEEIRLLADEADNYYREKTTVSPEKRQEINALLMAFLEERHPGRTIDILESEFSVQRERESYTASASFVAGDETGVTHTLFARLYDESGLHLEEMLVDGDGLSVPELAAQNPSAMQRMDGNGSALIDDSAVSEISTWSSEKIAQEMENKLDREEFDAVFSVTEPSVNLYQPSTDGWIDTSVLLGSGAVRTDGEKDKGYCVTPPIPVEGGKTYTISPKIATASLEAKNRARTYADDDTPLDVMEFTFHEDGSVTFTTPQDSAYIRFTVGKAEFTQNFDELMSEFNAVFMLAEGDEAPSAYTAYSPPSVVVRNVELADGTVTAEKLDEDARRMASPLAGKTIANFGDSIFGNARPPHDISTMLAERTGAIVYNCAFGGCRMGPHNGHWDAFSMYRLAEAIARGDYSLQEEALKFKDRTSYAEEPLATIESIDFSTLDILTIAYGTNDFSGNNPIDNPENPLDTSTVCGALRYSIETLLEAYPQLHIFVLLPMWRFEMDEEGNFLRDTSTITNGMGKTLSDYMEAIADTARAYSLPVIDNYYELGINRFNRSQYFNENDGAHHNKAGRERIAEHLAHELW